MIVELICTNDISQKDLVILISSLRKLLEYGFFEEYDHLLYALQNCKVQSLNAVTLLRVGYYCRDHFENMESAVQITKKRLLENGEDADKVLIGLY